MIQRVPDHRDVALEDLADELASVRDDVRAYRQVVSVSLEQLARLTEQLDRARWTIQDLTL